MKPVASALLSRLPADYAIARARAVAASLQDRGLSPINASIGEPELEPAPALLAALRDVTELAAHARYPRIEGSQELRHAFAAMYARRYGVTLDPEREVLPLIGSKEGLVHVVLALADAQLPVYLPSVGYPVYDAAARIAGAPRLSLGGRWEDGYRAQLPEGGGAVGGVALVGSPSNPTGAIVGTDALAALVAGCRARRVALCFDAAYIELSGSAPRPPLPIASEGTDGVIELHSLSKTLGIPGWRVACAVGDADLIAALRRMKSFVDSGIPGPIQAATAKVLPDVDAFIDSARAVFRDRHAKFRAALDGVGLEIFSSDAGLFGWVRVPGVKGEVLNNALEQEAVIAIDGASFGEAGADCVRMTVSIAPARHAEFRQRVARAVDRVRGAQMKTH